MTGRRMKSSVFTAFGPAPARGAPGRRRGLDLHARARHEAQLAVGHHALARGRTPLVDHDLPGQARPQHLTGRDSTVWSGFTTKTNGPCWPVCTACAGTTTARGSW